jgi:hypothetical protein
VTAKRYYTAHLEGATRVWDERFDQRVDFRYVPTPRGGSYSQNAWGRLAAVEFRNPTPNNPETFSYRYSYNQVGRITNQRMRITPGPDGQGMVVPANLDAAYAWENEGRMTSVTGPSNGPVETYTYDVMGRLTTGGATYGPAGDLLTFNGVTRTYNTLGQLTGMTKSRVMDMEYRYTAGQNNGRIWQSKDYVTGEEVTSEEEYFGGPVSGEQMWERLGRGPKRSRDALLKPDCAALFGGGPCSSPITVLSRLSNSCKFASIEDENNPDGTRTVTSAMASGSGTAMYGNIPVHTSVDILLNITSAGASFVSGNVNDWALTILHELGHAFHYLYGSAASQITPDRGSTAKSEANTALAKKICKL